MKIKYLEGRYGSATILSTDGKFVSEAQGGPGDLNFSTAEEALAYKDNHTKMLEMLHMLSCTLSEFDHATFQNVYYHTDYADWRRGVYLNGWKNSNGER